MDIERKRSGVRSIPDKTSTGTRHPVRRPLGGGGGRVIQPFEEGTKFFEYKAEPHRAKGRKKGPSPLSPPEVRVEKTQNGKRWLSPGEVELHGDVLEVRDAYGKIVDVVLLQARVEEKESGKRWDSPGEVELHGNVLEVRDKHGNIIDTVLLPSEEAKEERKPS